MSKSTVIDSNPTIKRWKPNHRYENVKLIDYELTGFKSTEKSLTDKEQYRINLASLRGQLASGLGSPTVGSYSLKAGEEYNPNNDFSYIYRPDVSLVELNEYIENKKQELLNSDSVLKTKIQDELTQAENRVKELQKAELQKAEVKKSE